MKLTREEALKYHRQMWTDMQKELGDKPSFGDRMVFKHKWCKEHFPNEEIDASCFLCEYVNHHEDGCDYCPIKWDDNYDDDCCMGGGVNYEYSPISVILALPERKLSDE